MVSRPSWSHDRLIFNMGIPITGKDGLYIETGLFDSKQSTTKPCAYSMGYTVYRQHKIAKTFQDSKVHGADMSAPGGPNVGPINLAIRVVWRANFGDLSHTNFEVWLEMEKWQLIFLRNDSARSVIRDLWCSGVPLQQGRFSPKNTHSTGRRFNINTSSYQYRKSHCGRS